MRCRIGHDLPSVWRDERTGITENLITALSKVSGLHVAAVTEKSEPTDERGGSLFVRQADDVRRLPGRSDGRGVRSVTKEKA